MKRVFLFLATNLAVMVVLGVVTSMLGVNKFLTANGLNLPMLLAFFCCGWFYRCHFFTVDLQADGQVEHRRAGDSEPAQ